MKKHLLIALGTMALAMKAHAVLTGGLSFAGDYIPRNAAGAPVTDLTLATQVQFGNLPSVDPNTPNGPSITIGVASGSFAAIPNGTSLIYGTGAPATFSLSFTPPNTPISPFFTVGNFTFALSTVNRDFADFDSLLLSGTGIFNTVAPGTDATAGTYTASFNTAAGTFSYSASAGIPVPPQQGVPDGGSALALLGMALVGVEALRRKLAV